jgi:hypothetical protein
MILVVLSVFITSTLAFNDTVNLVELDKKLTNLLLNPEPGKGNVILSDGYFLYTNLDDVVDLIEAKDPKGMQLYEDIVNQGGIHFHKTSYDPDKVRETFQYSPDDYEMLQATLGGVENTWNNILLLLNVTTTPQPHTVNPLTQW